MNTRIQQFLQTEQITPSKFADTLGVQRSNISHILTGRNKPSFDFIEKMLKSYPQINPDWLILGKGSMNRDSYRNISTEPDLFSNNESMGKLNTPIDIRNPVSNNQPNENNEPILPPVVNGYQSKNIVRVMVFYSDNTFETYNPS